MNKFHTFALIGILTLALFLRLYRVTTIPPGVNRDEASIGYTAYSLLKTGADEYGRHLPLSFQSFGDWKLPLYIYATTPFVALFGLNEFSVRIVSVLSGVSTVVLTYYLVQLLLESSSLALLSSLLMAISPWHIHLSRVESESNVAVFFTTLGILCIVKSFRSRPWLAVVGSILLALTYYTYHGNHIFTTLLVIGFVWIVRKQVNQLHTKKISLLLFGILVGFILTITLTKADKTKIAGISIFGDATVVHERIELPRNDHTGQGDLIARLIHNRLTYSVETIAKNYLKAFSPEFLFFSGGSNHAHNIPNFGNMYLIEAPLLLLGLFVCIMNRKKQGYTLILWWMLVAPVAASITKDAPHTNRMFPIFPALPIVVAMGIQYLLLEFFQNKRILAIACVTALYIANGALYLDRYYVHFPKNEIAAWGTGYKNLWQYISAPSNKQKTIIMANPQESPYMYFLFYGKTDPRLFQQNAQRYPPTSDGFYHVRSFGRFEFRSIDWDRDIYHPNALLVDYVSRIPAKQLSRTIPVAQFGVVPTIVQ